CAGWKKFFAHADKALAYVLRATGHPVVHGQYSDQAMHQLASRTPRVETKF
ncbi:anaerobic sulfatase maturase, partial [Vibrio alginolyticus]|nr:anaerobic sulfatase maturase [Vibrio alginolyticus]